MISLLDDCFVSRQINAASYSLSNVNNQHDHVATFLTADNVDFSIKAKIIFLLLFCKIAGVFIGYVVRSFCCTCSSQFRKILIA